MNNFPGNFVTLSRTIFLTIVFSFFPVSLYAVGLSELKVHSYLGEEFAAEVEIYGVDTDDPDILDYYNVTVDPVSDSQPGIQKYVKNLSVKMEIIDNKAKLIFSHRDYYFEPYIEFSVFISSGYVNLSRNYTALLDFRGSKIAQRLKESETTQTKEVATTVESAPALWKSTGGTRVVRPGETLYTIARDVQRQYGGDLYQIMEYIFTTNPRAFINNNRNLILAGASLNIASDVGDVQPVESMRDTELFEEYGPVEAGDTLYKIARRYQHQYDDASFLELANKIYELNPHAFINNDINLLRQGVMLKLPPSDEISAAESALTQESEVEQKQAEKEGEPDEHFLEILVAEPEESEEEMVAGDENAQIQQQLNKSMVGLEDVYRENSELKNSISQSNKQIEILQQNLEASNARMEELQAQLNELKGTETEKPESTTQPYTPEKQEKTDGTFKTVMDELIGKFMAYPWTVLIIIVIVGVAIVALIIIINNMKSGKVMDIDPDKVYQPPARLSDDVLKARIKEKVINETNKTEFDEDDDTELSDSDFDDWDNR